MKQGADVPTSMGRLRNEDQLRKWLCRQVNASKLRGTTLANPGSIDGSVLGRTVQLRVKFHYTGAIPIDGIMIHLNGKVYTRNADATSDGNAPWTLLDPAKGQARVEILPRKGDPINVTTMDPEEKKRRNRAWLPTRPLRNTGFDDELRKCPVDMNHVSVYNICMRHYDNRGGRRLSVAHSIGPDYQACHDVDPEWYEAQKTLGGLPYAFADLKPNTAEHTQLYALKTAFKEIKKTNERVKYQFLNPAFIATMRFVSGGYKPGDGNVWNGLWEIPRGLCNEIGCKVGSKKDHVLHRKFMAMVERQRRDQDSGDTKSMDMGPDDAEDDAEPSVLGPHDTIPGLDHRVAKMYRDGSRPIRNWYAVMRKHPLTWAMEGMYDEQRQSYGVNSTELRIGPSPGSKTPSKESPSHIYEERVLNGMVQVPEWAPFVYCYILPDVQLETLMHQFNQTFQNRVDLRVLGQVGFVIGPYRREQCHVYTTIEDGTKEPVFTADGQQAWQAIEGCDVSFEIHMQYMVWPELPGDVTITPHLRHDFPSLQQWVTDPMGGIDVAQFDDDVRRYQKTGQVHNM